MTNLREQFVYSKSFLTITMEVIRSFLQHMRGCWKHNFLEKRQNFQWGKKLWPAFSRIMKCDKPQRKDCKGLHGFFIVTVLVILSILQDIRVCWKVENTIFLEKRQTFQCRKKLWPTFSHFIEHNKGQEAFFEGPQCLLTIFLQLIKIYPWDLRGR